MPSRSVSLGVASPAWRPAPASPALRAGEVHVWRGRLSAEAALASLPALAPDELVRAARFHRQADRDRFAAARGLLRAVLSRYVGLPPHRLRFGYGPHGKPELDVVTLAGLLQFNLAHSGGWALLAVAAGARVGVDVEEERPLPDLDALAARHFTAAEQADMARAGEPVAAFYACWTRKEALVKALGEGVASPHLATAVGTRAVGSTVALSPGDVWTLAAGNPDPGYAGALVVEGRPSIVHYWNAGGVWAPKSLEREGPAGSSETGIPQHRETPARRARTLLRTR